MLLKTVVGVLTYFQWKLELEGTALGWFFGFKSLCLRNHTTNTTIKQQSKCLMECNVCIWLARNNKVWSSKGIDLSLKTPEDSLVHQNPLWTLSKANYLKINLPLPVGFINKGNSCYTNAILQTLSVLPSLWNRVPQSHHFYLHF